MAGSSISDNKGVNVPGVTLPISALTEKDREDLASALEIGVDWIALSFVQRPEDVTDPLKGLVAGRSGVMVKLEKPSAMAKLDEIVDLTDAVMLSAESAVGDYPIESVMMMDRIIKRVEADPRYGTHLEAEGSPPENSEADAITACARLAAKTVETAAIVTYTTSGSTALRMARIRPQAPVLAMTPSMATAQRLAPVWGLHAMTTDNASSVTEIVNQACYRAVHEDFAEGSDRLVITAGMPFGDRGSTNLLRIATVPE